MADSSDPGGAEVIARLQAGGMAALAELFVEHRDRLRQTVAVRLDRRAAGRIDPSDVLQEAFLDASRRLDEYLNDPPMSPFVWLRFLASQCLMAAHRQHLGVQKRAADREVSLNRRLAPPADSVTLSCQLLGRLTSPSAAAVRDEMQRRLQEVIDGMGPMDREILVLRHFEELTNGEAAEALGISEEAASKRYIRALKRLRAVLATMPEFASWSATGDDRGDGKGRAGGGRGDGGVGNRP